MLVGGNGMECLKYELAWDRWGKRVYYQMAENNNNKDSNSSNSKLFLDQWMEGLPSVIANFFNIYLIIQQIFIEHLL